RRTTIIPLVPPSLAGSSDRPGGVRRAHLSPAAQRRRYLPIWSCSMRGLACHRCCQRRGALLPHLFTLTLRLASGSRRTLASGRYIFCATFLQVTLTGRYPAHCPAEFGLSSPRLAS